MNWRASTSGGAVNLDRSCNGAAGEKEVMTSQAVSGCTRRNTGSSATSCAGNDRADRDGNWREHESNSFKPPSGAKNKKRNPVEMNGKKEDMCRKDDSARKDECRLSNGSHDNGH